MNNLVFVVILLLMVAIVVIASNSDTNSEIREQFECNNQSPTADQINSMGSTAKDACNRISSKAEEIKAHYDGAKGIIDSALAFMSPNNYRSGDNTSNDIMRNIINTNLSTCEISKIQSDCVNSSANVQTNTIDNTKCKYCQTNLCTISNVTQSNIIKISQTCTIQSAIEILLKKKASVDSQALAQVLQEAQGLLSGDNKFSKENCNIITPDLSTSQYMDVKATCANKLAVDQENTLQFCGNVTDVIQTNQFKAYQDCSLGATVKNSTDVTSDNKTEQTDKVQQETSGLTPLSFTIGAIVSLLTCSCVIAIIFAVSRMKMSNKKQA
jgi:hypothetical protein